MIRWMWRSPEGTLDHELWSHADSIVADESGRAGFGSSNPKPPAGPGASGTEREMMIAEARNRSNAFAFVREAALGATLAMDDRAR